ncbi:ROK family transcriptional regulator [Paenibacillus mesotrionivorans]|uniref:ROK family protein n=1 Tax=Paenibacillus mesotrionivorans TaxID=3160968 RepID=A0ACC7NVL5_9BACL
MKITGDLNLMKKINKSIVLELLRKASPLSRAEVAKTTGLTKATVSTLVAELMEENLLYEIGTGESSGGRKPVLLVFRQDAGYAIGVDLGVRDIHAVLTDLKGTIVHETRSSLRGMDTPEQVLGRLKDCLRRLMNKAPASPYGVVGIGVGVPGITDDKGTVLFAPNLGWRNVPLQSLLEAEFKVPVIIDNEANAGAVGEKEFGIGRDVSNLIYISVGIGIGSGIILKDELYRGASGYSGEMGHFTVHADGRPCRCGNVGCWELYASEQAILAEAEALLSPDAADDGSGAETAAEADDSATEVPRQAELEALASLADSGNEAAQELFRRTGRYLGVGVVNIINTFNPELIIIGNRFTLAERWLAPSVREVIQERALPYHRERLRLEFAGLGLRSSVAGAASFAVSGFFADRQVSVGMNG